MARARRLNQQTQRRYQCLIYLDFSNTNLYYITNSLHTLIDPKYYIHNYIYVQSQEK